MMQYTKNQIERDIAIIATDRDLLPSQGHGPGRIRIQSRIHIREGIHIVNITIIFLFVEVHMSFLARSLLRGLSIRSNPFYAANMRWFSDMTEEQRVGLHLMCNEQNRMKMQEMMIDKVKKQAEATIVDIKDISYDAGFLYASLNRVHMQFRDVSGFSQIPWNEIDSAAPTHEQGSRERKLAIYYRFCRTSYLSFTESHSSV